MIGAHGESSERRPSPVPNSRQKARASAKDAKRSGKCGPYLSSTARWVGAHGHPPEVPPGLGEVGKPGKGRSCHGHRSGRGRRAVAPWPVKEGFQELCEFLHVTESHGARESCFH